MKEIHQNNENNNKDNNKNDVADDDDSFSNPLLGRSSASSSLSSNRSIKDDNNNNHHHHPLSRYLMLSYICLLNVLSGWTCYSIAPISKLITESTIPIVLPPNFTVTFLYSASLSAILYPKIISRWSLRRTVQLGAFALCLGSLLKSSLFAKHSANGWCLHISFFIAGLGKPLVLCPARRLSENWFPSNERRMATEVAVYSHQLGVGMSYIVGSFFVCRTEHVYFYSDVIAFFSLVVLIMVYLQFRGSPEEDVLRGLIGWNGFGVCGFGGGNKQDEATGENQVVDSEQRYQQLTPLLNDDESKSDLINQVIDLSLYHHQQQTTITTQQQHQSSSSSFLSKLQSLSSHYGFIHTMCVYSASTIVINIFSTFMEYLLRVRQQTTRIEVGYIGALFQLLVVLSSIVIGIKTDEKKNDYHVIIITFLVIGGFVMSECSIKLDMKTRSVWTVLFTAMVVGPLQPVATKVAVELTSDSVNDESDVICIQEFFGNLLSAVFMPIFYDCRFVGMQRTNGAMYTFSFYLLVLLFTLTAAMFLVFTGPYLYERYYGGHDDRIGGGSERDYLLSPNPSTLSVITDDSPNNSEVDNTVRRHSERQLYIDKNMLKKHYNL